MSAHRLSTVGILSRIVCGTFTLAALAGAEGIPSKPLLTAHVQPKTFGIQDSNVTVVSALAFQPRKDFQETVANLFYYISPSLGVYCSCSPDHLWEWYAGVDIPPGAVIDFIGVNSTTNIDGVLGVALWERHRNGQLDFRTGFSLPAHGWDTDFSGPLNIQVPTNSDREWILNVEQVGQGFNYQFWAWVEVWWHRTVSPPPGAATFNDVPTNHPFFQFIEALYAAGITAGCQSPPLMYCPDRPITRGEMAVFLAKALGLHWED